MADSRFLAILKQIGDLHEKKSRDYGSDTDPYANVRASEEIGIVAWKGGWLRTKDKVKRIDTFCVRGTLENEGVEDSFLDLATYAIIDLILYRETQAAAPLTEIATPALAIYNPTAAPMTPPAPPAWTPPTPP